MLAGRTLCFDDTYWAFDLVNFTLLSDFLRNQFQHGASGDNSAWNNCYCPTNAGDEGLEFWHIFLLRWLRQLHHGPMLSMHPVVQHLQPYGWRVPLWLVLLRISSIYPQGQATNWTAYPGFTLQRCSYRDVLHQLRLVPDGPWAEGHWKVKRLLRNSTSL